MIKSMERKLKSRKAKTEAEKSIPEMADEVTREEMRQMYRDGKLTAYGRRMSKFLERALPDEKVDEWGWNLSRKERAAFKRRAAEKKAAVEKKKAEARARAAYRRRIKRFEENGVIEGFAQMNWAFMEAREELKRRGFSFRRMNAMKRAVVARISKWNRQHHRDYVEYFVYQYYKGCEQLYVESLPKAKRAEAKKAWARALEPFKRPEPWLCPSTPPCPAGCEGKG